MKTNLFFKDRIKLYPKNAIKKSSFSLVVLLLVFTVQQSFAQDTMVGDGFGANPGYTPTNYGVGAYNGYAICNGTLKGWGDNNHYQLGNGSTAGSFTPVNILTNVKYFSAGYAVAAIKNDNTLWAWGGSGGAAPLDQSMGAIPSQIDTNVKFVSAGLSHIAYCKYDGTAWVAGPDGAYCTYCNNTTPHQVIGISNCVRTATVNYTLGGITAFLLSDGTVKYIFKYGTQSNIPQLLPFTNVVDIKGCAEQLFILKSDGTVWICSNGFIYPASRLDVPVGVSIKAISASNDGLHLLALSTTGNVYAWTSDYFAGPAGPAGTSLDGVVGNDGCVLVATNVKDIMAGETFSYIVKNDGTLWATGASKTYDNSTGGVWMNLPNTITNNYIQINPYSAPMNLCAIVSECNAGTTAPTLSGIAINSSCSSTTVNLNTLVTSSTPSGAALVWFTNNAHSGTAYATPTTTTTGTYYAFYYDSTNSCYSPATVAVTVTIISPPSVPTVASTTQPTCSVSTGTIVFTTQSGVQYSVDNGGTYQASPTFSGLAVGTYILKVRSTTDSTCSTTAASPVTIAFSRTGANDDFDCDGVINSIDIDDDNDGVLDTVECPVATNNNLSNFKIGCWGQYPIGDTNMMLQVTNPVNYGPNGISKTGVISFVDVTTDLSNMTAAQLYAEYPIINMSTDDPTVNEAQKIYDYVNLGGVVWHSYNVGLGSVLFQKFGGTGTVGTINAPTTYETNTSAINNGKFGDVRNQTGFPNTYPSGIIYSSQLPSTAKIFSTCNSYSSVAGFTMGDKGTALGRVIFVFDELQFIATGGGLILWNTDKFLNNLLDYAIDVSSIRSTIVPTACDTDGDGIINSLDLDSDGDGCSDAKESGATTSNETNYVFPGPYGANGLQNSLETAPESGIVNYTLNYDNAINSAVKACVITCPTVTNSASNNVNPTTCSGTNGSIKLCGLAANVSSYTINYSKNGSVATPLTNQTADASGCVLISNLGAGVYNNIIITHPIYCTSGTTTLGPITLTAIGIPSVPTVASTMQPTCSVPTGTIVFTTQSGVQYSVDNGVTYQASPTFSGLTVGTYILKVRNTTDITCSTVAASPVTITAATNTTTPNLTISGAICNGATYTVNYSSNGVVTSSAGAVTTTAITGIPVGTNALITATTTNGCASTTTTVTSPASCTTPPVGCITPTLSVGSGVCSGTGTYSVSVTASSGATITSSAGTVFGYLVTGIPLATAVTITATSGTCTNSVTVSSPTNCTTPCATTAVSYSRSGCLGTTYTVFISNPNSATITATAGTVSATAITNIPIGTNLTLTATATGCTSEIVTLNSPASCVIDAITETTDALNGTIGGTTSSLTTNDTLNGIPVVIGTSPGNVTLKAVSFPTGLTLNTATGQVTVAANTPAGTYPVVYSICDVNNIGVCDTVTSYIVVVIADFTPTIDIDNVVFLSAGVTRDFVVNISNIESGPSVGQVVFKIFKQSAFTITYSPTTTSSNVSGGISVNNNDWLITENASFITITLKQNVIINASTISSVGFAISRNSNIPTQTSQPITVTIVNGFGGDSLGVNNTYNVVIKAQ